METRLYDLFYQLNLQGQSDPTAILISRDVLREF